LGPVSWLITRETSSTLICVFSAYIGNMLSLIDKVVGRLKAHGLHIAKGLGD